jgi:DNA polymerase (family 10)
MVEAARKKGYRYLAITDHSKRLSMTHGLDEKRLDEQMEEIDRLNEKLDGFRVLKSIEVDILEDGTLDLSDEVLRKTDLVVCSIHHKFRLPQEKQTERIIRAISGKPYFIILGHPTGRLIGKREAYDLNMERLMKAAHDQGCAMEVNAQPDRLDLIDVHCKMAKDMGVMVAISTDAHSVHELDFMRYGVTQGRRGWLEARDVLNTRTVKQLMAIIHRKQAGKGG